MTKTYTLELTAEELQSINAHRTDGYEMFVPAKVHAKLSGLAHQARADREAGELRLPWSAKPWHGSWWQCVSSGDVELPKTERAAKLMSAAPELLEAVKAACDCLKGWDLSMLGARGSEHRSLGARWDADVAPLIDRALRKVETGEVKP